MKDLDEEEKHREMEPATFDLDSFMMRINTFRPQFVFKDVELRGSFDSM